MSRSTVAGLNSECMRWRRSVSILSRLRLHRLQDLRDRSGEFFPRVGLRVEPCAAFLRQLVVLRAAVVVGSAPARLDPAAALDPMKRRVQRALLDVERRAGDLVEALRDRPSVLGLEGHGLQDEEIERALRKIESFVGHAATPLLLRQETTRTPVEAQGFACRNALSVQSSWPPICPTTRHTAQSSHTKQVASSVRRTPTSRCARKKGHGMNPLATRRAQLRLGALMLLTILLTGSAVYAQQINRAAGRPATASSSAGASYTPDRAVDGSTSTRWSSAFSNSEWWSVDLGASYSVTKVVINWEAAYATAYDLQVSADGVAWTTFFSGTNSFPANAAGT